MKNRWPILLRAVFFLSITLHVACDKNSLHIDLAISPNPPRMIKPVTLTLRITDANGQAVTNADVTGTLTMKAMDMGKTELKFAPAGNGNYEASTKEMDMSGEWNLAVDAAQGAAHTRKVFDFTVGD